MKPILVKITRNDDGSAKWPAFRNLSSAVRKGMKFGDYIEAHGISWHYDKVENLGTGHAFGRAVSVVPDDFADAAAAAFNEVSIITETQLQNFWDTRSHVYEEDEIIDTTYMDGLTKKKQLMEARGINGARMTKLEAEIDKALDPDDSHRGVIENKSKTWAKFKAKRKITL